MVKKMPSILCLALASSAMQLAWFILWMLSVVAASDIIHACDCAHDSDSCVADVANQEQTCVACMPNTMAFPFLVSKYWGGLVLVMIVHVTTVAGVAEWWT